MTMTSHHYRALGPHGFHRIHYTEWGDPANPKALICAHGLTRTGRDFDFLAAALAQDYRVICPDVVGRGQSDWLNDKADYTYPLYVNDLAMLVARIDAERIDWVGTSMGGLIGIFLASYPGAPIHKLVINDIGPRIPAAGLQRVAAYVGQVVAYDSIEKMERFMRTIAAPFGKLTDE
ncbi:MAG: alpha/beta hydrolase, partial [Candidatus Contendobacter sp.]|nr:alpha/beta hydrolase [Candidatus Contendobacter sp.]